MASVKATNITNIDASPSVLANAGDVHGSVRVFKDTYEASSLGAGSDITVARLPKGARVVDIHLKADALGGSVTLAVGDSADPDRYITATAAANAGVISMHNEGAIGGVGFEQTAETDILITTGGAAATGTIKCMVFYTVE